MTASLRARILERLAQLAAGAVPEARIIMLRAEDPAEAELPAIEIIDQGHSSLASTLSRAAFELRVDVRLTVAGAGEADTLAALDAVYVALTAALFASADLHWTVDGVALIRRASEQGFEVYPLAEGQRRAAQALLRLSIEFTTGWADRTQPGS